MTSVRQVTAKLLTILLTTYLFYYLQVQQACHPGNPLRDIIFQVDRCEDALFTKCNNVGYAISAMCGSIEIDIPEGRYAFRIETPMYKSERKTAFTSYDDSTRIFYLFPPSGKCQ